MNMKRLFSYILTIALFVGTLCTLTAYAADVTTTESITEGWKLLRSNDPDITVGIKEGKDGGNCFFISNNTPSGNNRYVRLLQNVKVKQGVTYKYGLSVKADKVLGANIMLGTYNKASIIPFGNTFGWTDLEFEYRYEGADADVMFNVVVDNSAGELFLDNFYLYATQDGKILGENMLANSDFELSERSSAGESVQESELKIITAEEFLSTSKAIPIYRTNSTPPNWDEFTKINMFDYYMISEYLETADNTVSIKYAYDDENFYIQTEVIDNTHYSIEGNTYWQGDGLQIAFAEEIGVFKLEVGISYNQEKDMTAVTNELVKAKTVRVGERTTYDITVPWKVFTSHKPESFQFNAIVNDNDNDGYGRKYAHQIAPGIVTGKDATEYPVLYTADSMDADYFAALTGSELAMIRTSNPYKLMLQNLSEETGNYQITLPDGKHQTVQVPSSGAMELKFDYIPQQSGNTRLETAIQSGEETQQVGIDVIFVPDYQEYLVLKSECEAWRDELKELLDDCEAKGIPTDYEQIDYYTIDRFIEYMVEDADVYQAYDRVLYSYNELKKIYQNSAASLKQYLSGEKNAVSVPRYVNSKISTDGLSLVAEMEQDGKSERRPMFMTGYITFMQKEEDIPVFDKFGGNYSVAELKLYDTVTRWVDVPKWNLYENVSVGCEYTTAVTEEESKNGTYSLKYTRQTPWENGRVTYLRQAVNVKPNTTYHFGLSAKGKNVDGVHFSCHPIIDSNYGLSQRIRHYINGSYDWTDFSSTYTTGQEEYILEFFIPMEAKVESLYIDDVYIIEEGTNQNLLQNGDFELGHDPNPKKYDIYTGHVDNLCHLLEKAEKNNIAMSVLIAPHYFPSFPKNDDPTVRDANGAYPAYMGFNPTHPTVLELVDLLVEAVIPRIKGYACVNDLCFSNEPNIQVYNTQYYTPYWQEYLKNKYCNDLAELNRICGTNYQSFEEITMNGIEEMTVLYNHMMDFNEDILTEYLGHISDEVLKYAPEFKVHAKILPCIQSYSRNTLKFGANYEKLAPYYTINGLDANATYKNLKQNLLSKLEWYDLQTSIKEMPIMNTEDHIAPDEMELDYSPKVLSQSLADIWQGGIHGRGSSAVWLWDRGKSYITNEFLNTNLMARPDFVSGIGREFLDLNRLSHEITALQKEKRKVAILYSHTSHTYTPSYLNNVYEAYTNTLFNGLKPLLLVESQMEKLDEYDLLIIPEATHVYDSTVDAIKRFAERGGKIVMISDRSLSKNEFAQDRNTEVVREIRDKAIIVPTDLESRSEMSSAENLDGVLREVFQSMNFHNIRVIDQTTGKDVDDVEWLCAKYEDGYVLNLCNYDWDNEKNVSVMVGDDKIMEFDDLKKLEVTKESLTLKPYTPVFVKFK